jgi:hypothetical protein
MAITVADLFSTLHKNLGDYTNDSVSTTEKYDALTEATVWLIEHTTNEHAVRTYDINYIDTVHAYKISNSIADMLEPADLRRGEEDQTIPATRKSSREMAEDIANKSPEFAFTVERKNGNSYAIINLRGKYPAQSIASFDSVTDDGGSWTADTVNSDATNVTTDNKEFTEGDGSINFDINVSQSSNNFAAIYNTNASPKDLSDYGSDGVLLIDVYIPDATYTSSITFRWGNNASNYFSATVTTDVNGNPLSSGWNSVAFNWEDATETGTVNVTAIKYYYISINYTASQFSDTDYRLDNLRIAKPEKLVFHYISQSIGKNSSGNLIYKFSAQTDVPYFSGQYDNYKFPVCHKAAEILFSIIGLYDNARKSEKMAEEALSQKQKLFSSVIVPEDRSFKVKQISFRRRKF